MSFKFLLNFISSLIPYYLYKILFPTNSNVRCLFFQLQEVEEYFTNYIVNDSLGIIANAHTAFADKEPLKAMSDPCIELAKLFSIAVDFNKTGVPAVIPPKLHVKEYPDFMDKPDKLTYESRNVIGKLFREVKDIAPNTNTNYFLILIILSPSLPKLQGGHMTLIWKLMALRISLMMLFITRKIMMTSWET